MKNIILFVVYSLTLSAPLFAHSQNCPDMTGEYLIQNCPQTSNQNDISVLKIEQKDCNLMSLQKLQYSADKKIKYYGQINWMTVGHGPLLVYENDVMKRLIDRSFDRDTLFQVTETHSKLTGLRTGFEFETIDLVSNSNLIVNMYPFGKGQYYINRKNCSQF